VLLAWPALLAVGSIGLSGCFTTSSDYQRDAEEFIVGDEDLRLELFAVGESLTADTPKFTSATCDDPQSQDVGTTFLCTAKDTDDGDWVFQVEIQESNTYGITVSRQPT
jgi:hypothetical protein